MSEILLTTLADALGGSVPTTAVLTAKASKVRTVGATVTAPDKASVRLTDGVPDVPVILPAPGVDWYWALTLTFPSLGRTSITRYVQFPDVPSIEWSALVDIDRATMQPDPGAVPAWEAAVAQVQAAANTAGVARDEAVSARTDAQSSAASAGESSTAAAWSATEAAGSASTAAGHESNAGLSATSAAGSASIATTAREAAESAEADAVQARLEAMGFATSATDSAIASAASAAASVAARDDAQAARDAAGQSATAAAGSAVDAATAKAGAQTARDEAQTTAAGVPTAVAIALAAQAGKIIQGIGMPNGVVTATPGTIYVDTANTMGASVWRKASGAGSTGWMVLNGNTGARNISSLLSTGWIQPTGAAFISLVRENDRVSITGRVQTSSTPAQNILVGDIPNGFQPTDRYGGHGPALSGTISAMVFSSASPLAFQVSVMPVAGSWLLFNASFLTRQPWPATLPGTPA